MKKIPTLFVRDYSNGGFVIPEVNPVAEWVMEDAYPAHRKYDGVCTGFFPTVKGEVRINKDIGSGEVDKAEDISGIWMIRREVKQGWEFPDNFEIEQFDPQTKKTFGWVPIQESSYYKYFLDALDDLKEAPTFGTYELCGPKINGNPENFKTQKLVNHEQTELISNIHVLDFHEMSVEDAYEALKETLDYMPIEGVVWRSAQHGMVKLKKKDFRYE